MAVEEQKNYGKKIEYDPLWKGPLEHNRSTTDPGFLISFIVYFVLWIGTGVYVLTAYSEGGNTGTDDDLNEFRSPDKTSPVHPYLSIKIASGFIILAGIISVLYIFLLRWHAKFVVYTSFFVICIILLGAVCAAIYIFSSDTDLNAHCLYLAIVQVIVLIVLIIFFVRLRKKIEIACEVIREAGKVVLFFPSSLLFTMLPFFLYILATVYAGSVYFTLKMNSDPTALTYFLHFINGFGYLWVVGFVTGFAQMSLSGSFATWYWTMHKNNVPSYTLLRFMKTTARYHLGTIAFGSLIIAICQLIQYILSSVRERLQNNSNALACCCLSWYEFLFKNLQYILDCISRNAYVMSAVHGTSFIQSAKDAFHLLMRNIVKVLVTTSVTDGIIFLGYLLAVGLSLLATWGYCNSQNLAGEMTTIALVIVGICSFLISVSLFMVLQTAIDTIFVCVMEDSERNDGSDERPYYMSFELKSLLFPRESV